MIERATLTSESLNHQRPFVSLPQPSTFFPTLNLLSSLAPRLLHLRPAGTVHGVTAAGSAINGRAAPRDKHLGGSVCGVA
jgi:hypothetical protein